MTQMKAVSARWLGVGLRAVLWVVGAVMALVLLAVAVVLLLVGLLWALVRGRRPVPPPWFAQAQHHAARRVWPGAAGAARPPRPRDDQVVDVDAREVEIKVERKADHD